VAVPAIDSLPGYRRRFRVTPGPGEVMCELEDDNHCMAVTVRHRDGVATEVRAEQPRAPWTTCPGAVAKVEQTFTGTPLEAFARRGEKTANCTHLYDLAQLAAAHAHDEKPIVYDILVSDPVEGRRRLELRRDGTTLLTWLEAQGRLVDPPQVAGLQLMEMRDWLDALPADQQEPARLLRWGGLVAHGRTLPFELQSDATRMPPNCFTFQPDQAPLARRVGEGRDFSAGTAEPLDRRPQPRSGATTEFAPKETRP
jgi:hypothetical protein